MAKRALLLMIGVYSIPHHSSDDAGGADGRFSLGLVFAYPKCGRWCDATTCCDHTRIYTEAVSWHQLPRMERNDFCPTTLKNSVHRRMSMMRARPINAMASCSLRLRTLPQRHEASKAAHNRTDADRNATYRAFEVKQMYTSTCTERCRM